MSLMSIHDPSDEGRYPDKDAMIESILDEVGDDIPTLQEWAESWLQTKSYADIYEMCRHREDTE